MKKIKTALCLPFPRNISLAVEMIVFLKSVRTGHWDLNITSLNSFCKYFFASDKFNYARLVPLYITDKQQVKNTVQYIYDEFMWKLGA